MTAALTVLVILMSFTALAVTAALVWSMLLWQRQHRTEAMIESMLRRGVGAATEPQVQPVLAVDDPNRVLAQPPQVPTGIGPLATGDWLTHYAVPGTTWPGVVGEFYTRLLKIQPVRELFPESPGRAAQIKAHFTRVMVTITKKGITVKDREDLRAAHAHLPITGDIYDIVINTLIDVLTEVQVPGYAIQDLGRMLGEAELREVIVHEVVLHDVPATAR